MKTEKGITLTTLTVTLIIMAILATLLVGASVGQGLYRKINGVEQNLFVTINDTNTKTESIQDAWEGVI